MAGDFSVPSLLIGKTLQGAVNRVREHQDAEWKDEQSKRDKYMAQLSALIPTAATGADIEAINEEIARVQSEPREKQFKPRLLKTPSFAPPKVQGGGGGGAAGQQATPPPFDFREVMAAITGAPQRSGQPDVPSAQGGPPESVGAIPPELMAMLGGEAPTAPTSAPMVPPVGAGLLMGSGMTVPHPYQIDGGAVSLGGPTSGTASGGAVPLGGGMPKVMTPPGRNVPEPSPLVGTLPGTPSPIAAPLAAPIGATPPAMGTPLPAVPPSPFMGIRERAELPYQLNEQYGMNRSGKPIGAAAGKPLLTVKDLISARDKGLEIISDSSSPTGYSVAAAAPEDLTAIDRAKLGLTTAQTKLTEARVGDISADNTRADDLVELRKKLAVLDTQRKEAKTAREIANIDFRRTMTVSRSYEGAIKWYTQRDIALDQALAQLDQATGVADYIAILSTVHAIDNTAAREGEVATVRSAAPFMTRIEQAIERFKSGQLLAPEMREEFRSALVAMKESHRAQASEVDEKYAYQTHKYMLDPKATGVGAGAGAAATPPPVTPATPPAAGSASTSPSVSRWERDPATGKLRKVK